MKHLEDHLTFAAAVQKALENERLHDVDFDKLEHWLGRVRHVLRACSDLAADVAMLREDYQGRIAGMAKAIAVAGSRVTGIVDPGEYLSRLPELSVSDLVREYRVMAAKFRTAFPASFGQVRSGTGCTRHRSLDDFK